jgi:hypothetical protein
MPGKKIIIATTGIVLSINMLLKRAAHELKSTAKMGGG